MARSNHVKHIEVRAGLVYHHALVFRHDQVVHYTGTSADRSALEDGIIMRESYKDFTKKYTGKVRVVDRLYADKAGQAEERALSCLRIRDEYELASFNCESFVEWCKTGVPVSKQVDEFVERLAAGLIAGGVPGAIVSAGSAFL